MFETAVAYYLNEYLGTYVEGIDKDALSVSVIKGDVTLKNSRIKPDAFTDHFDLPVSVRAGMLETLTLKVPWNALGSTPVVVTVDGVYLLVRGKPQSQAETDGSLDTDDGTVAINTVPSLDYFEYFESGYQRAKMSRIQRKECAWVKEQKDAREVEAPSSSFLSSLIETIVGNLQISIKNIHIRYEDDVTRPGHAFACGFTLQNLEAFTIDASGDRRFVSAKAMDALRKAVQLKRLAVYFDSDLTKETLWSPSIDEWREMGSTEWDSWFRPAIVGDEPITLPSTVPTAASSYVLRPVDGEGRYVRKRDVAELDVQLDSIAVSVSQEQYRNYSLLLSEATEYLKRAPFQAFRPTIRPTCDPRAWWLYVLYAHRQQQAAKRRLSWAEVLDCVRRRPEYISLYKVYLRMEDMRNDTQSAITGEIEALYERDLAIMHNLETQLPESCIFMFRRAARKEYLAEMNAYQAAQAAAEAESRRRDSGSRGWLGWLMGTATTAPEAITTVTTKEEQDLIVDALAATASEHIPDDMVGRQRRYAVRVNSVSINLVDKDWQGRHRSLLRGSMTGIGVHFVAYPDHDMEMGTRDVRLSVDGSAIDSYKGSFTESKSLGVHFVKSPPDGLSDASLRVDMAPSFVYYDPEVVSSVIEFFKPPEELVLNDLADLSVAAAAQLSRARQLAQEYAIATWSGKPKLDMRLRLNAPKISIPSKSGDVHLALDFGMFVIETDREGLAALPPHEMGLYECIKVSGSQVSARFMGTVVDWEAPELHEPLLDECSLDMPLHIARYVDAELPALRAAPTIPRIRLTISPKKVNHLVRVLQNCVESFSAPDPSATVTAISEEAWLGSAEWKRDSLLLQWSSLQSSASWIKQKLVLYSSTLYAVEVPSNRIMRQWTISASSVATRLSGAAGSKIEGSGHFDGADHVVILYEGDIGMDIRDVVRNSRTWVMKFDSVEDAESCLDELHAIIHRQNVEEAEIVRPSDSSDDYEDDKAEWISSLQIEVIARLTELQIQLAGRCHSLDTDRSVDGGESASPEVALVCMKASQGTLNISYGSKMRIGMSLVSLDVENLLSSSDLAGQGDGSHRNDVLVHSIKDASSSSNLADFSIVTWGSQTAISANLGSLCFFCHRPTVAALIAFGTDTAAVFSAQRDQTATVADRSVRDLPGAQEILAPEVVLFCEKKDAVTLALQVQLAKLQLRLCYEDGSSLAEVSMTELDFSMKNISDGRSQITASLGNLKAVDLTLDTHNPHAQICGLREEDSSSLVSISFEMIPAHAESSLRSLHVPARTPCYYLEARLSKVQVTFLYRFLQEQIGYIEGMLQFQPRALQNAHAFEPADGSASDDPALTKAPAAGILGTSPVLLMKVEMEAPLITIPRSSRSNDGFKADLGTLFLENKVVTASDAGTGGHDNSNGGATTVLVDASTLRLSGIRLYPTSRDLGDGQSLVRLSDEGWTVKWNRRLGNDPGSMPRLEVEVDIPTLDASMSTDEYGLLTTVVMDNLREPVREDVPAVGLDKQDTVRIGTPVADRTSVDSKSHHQGESVPSASDMEGVPSVDYRVYVNLGDLQLRLSNPASLSLLQVEKLYVSYTALSSGNTILDVSMPKLEVTDTRPHPSGESAIVISSGQHASMLVLRYATGPDSQELDIILQKPHIALELGFLIDLTAFFVPTFSFSRAEPLPYQSHDILLPPAKGSTPETFCLTEDIWLSPSVRLLADAECGMTYSLDGQGHRIVLPESSGMYDEIPLIMIGADCTLELRNVSLVNADSLSSCIRLGPGAHLDLSAERGVHLVNDGGNNTPEVDILPVQEPTCDEANIDSVESNGVSRNTSLVVRVKTVNLGLNLMPRRATGRLTTSSPSVSSATDASKRIIAFKMDLEGAYSRSSLEGQRLKVDVFALRAAQKSLKPRSLKATKEMDILLPTAISFGFTSTDHDIDMNLEISEVSLLVSPGSLALMSHYAEEALVPLRQPGPDSPVFAVSSYRKVVAPSDTNDFNEAWITFWRPTVPSGYSVGGDLAIGGDRAPNFEVIALARNSGLIAHPESFLPIISNDGLSLWLPVAPEGYVPLGLFATTGSPPNPEEVACIARGVAIAAPRGSSLQHWGGFDGISLVNVDNAFGTFVPQEAGAYDLRFPVGPTTYALSALCPLEDDCLAKSVEGSDTSGKMYQRAYMASEAKKQRVESRSVNSPKTMEFRRVWSDTSTFSGPAGVSIWRPVPHSGYAILGDCFVVGLDPPKFVHLLRVEAYLNQAAASSSAPPLDFEFVWHDGNPRPESRLTIWRPVAPEGFRSMGNIAHVGMTKPDLPELRCVQEQLAHPSVIPRRPVWHVSKDHSSTSPLNVWQVDEQTCCFFVDSSDRAVPPQAFTLDMSSLEGPEDSPGKTVNYVVRCPAISLTFFDSFGVPMARADIRKIESGIRGFSQQVVQAYGGFRPSLSAYNPKIGTWEHLIQPFDAIATGSLNMSKRTCSGIDPGMRLSLKSSTEMIASTLALSHLNAVVSSYEECVMALEKRTRPEEDAAGQSDQESLYGGRGQRTTKITNSLGVDVHLRLEDVETKEFKLVTIKVGQASNVDRTYHAGHVKPQERTKASARAILLVDVKDLDVEERYAGRRLAVSMRIESEGAEPVDTGLSPRTRAIALRDDARATFQERLALVYGLEDLSKAYCIVEVLDVEARGGRGAVIGRGTIPSSVLQGIAKVLTPINVSIEAASDVESMHACEIESPDTRARLGSLSCEVAWQRLGSLKKGAGGQETCGAVLNTRTMSMAEIVGRRMISVQGSMNEWKIIPESLRRPGRDRNHDDTPTGVRTAVLWGQDTIIVEGRISQHVWHETLRSNFKVENGTEIPLCMSFAAADGEEHSLGTILPHTAVPLPLCWRRPGSQLHIAPALFEEGSVKMSSTIAKDAKPRLRYGWGSVDVAALARSDGKNGELWTAHETPVECAPAIPGSGLAMMFCIRSLSSSVQDALDWKVEIVPPIKIRNHVPVPVSMFVADSGSQSSPSGTPDFPVHLDIVDPGGDLPIYFTGSKGSLRFRMDAGEYKWAEREMACLTGHGQRDSIRLQSDTQRIPSDIALSRYQTSPQSTYPVVITLISPLWILNKTDWMIEAAVVPVVGTGDRGVVALDPQHVPQEDSYGAVLVTSAAEESPGSELQGPSLVNSRQIPPKSLVLSSIPISNGNGSGAKNQTSNLGNPNSAPPATRAYGLRVRVQRSGWTGAILLDEEYARKHGAVALSSRPVLLKADSPPHSAVFGTVLRLEMNEFNDSRILHIDAQMLLQNSCRIDLEGFQTAIDRGRRLHGAHGEDPVNRRVGRGATRESILLPRGGIQLEDDSSHSFVQMADNSIQTILKAKAIFGIPADSVPRPLAFLRGAGAPTLCFRSAQKTAYDNVGIWSRPLQMDLLDEGDEYLILPCINAGSLEDTLLLRLSVTSRGPGLRLITLESTECHPRYVLTNLGTDELMYREVGWRGAEARHLSGLSAVGVSPAFSKDPDTFELEVFGHGMDQYARKIGLFDRSGEGGGLEGSEPHELVLSSTKSCVVRTLFRPPVCLSCVGLNPIAGAMSGYSVGRGGIEKSVDVMSISGRGSEGRRLTSALDPSDQRETFVVVEVPGVSLSIVDFEREIALLTFEDIQVEVDRILMPESVGSFVRFNARHVQVDNQLPGTLLPVTICKSVDSRSILPVMDFRHASYQSKARTGLHVPYIGCRTPNKIQLAVDERLVWKLVEYIKAVAAMRASSRDAAAMVRSVDAFVRLRLLSVAGMALSVSFQNNAKARPPSFQETSYSLMLDLAAFKGADVRLKGFEFENIHVSQSVMTSRVLERIKSELVSASFSLIRQFGIVGGATRIFGFLGAKVARFAEGPTTASVTPAAPTQDATFGASFLKGFRGVVGAFASGSKSQEKQDASFARGRSGVLMLQRKRLPRVLNEMSGMRDANETSSSLLESLGQAFLWSTWLASPLTQHSHLEDFEEHVVLPNGLVLLFTSASVLLVHAPGMAALDGAVERNGSLPAEIDPGTIQWLLKWKDIRDIALSSSVASNSQTSTQSTVDADAVIIRPTRGQVREISCFPGTPQAREIVIIATKIRGYYTVCDQ